MKTSQLRQIIKEEIQKALLADRIYDALSNVEEFNQLGMDQQGELVVQIEDMFNNLSENVEMDKMNQRFNDIVGVKPSTAKNTFKEKEYEVEYKRYIDDNYEDDVIKVKAKDEAEALEKAKEELKQSGKRNVRFDKLKIVK